MNWFSKRGKEASTWGGLGMILYGLGEVFKISEAPAVAEAVAQGGQAMASGTPWEALIPIGAGAIMTIMKDKNDTQ